MFELIYQIFIVRRRMVSYIYILLKLLSGWFKWGRKPSTPGEIEGKKKKKRKTLLDISYNKPPPYFLTRLKTEAPKREYFEGFKVSTWQIYLEWKEIPCVGRYGGLSWQDRLALGFGCTSGHHTQYRVFWLSKNGIWSKHPTLTGNRVT